MSEKQRRSTAKGTYTRAENCLNKYLENAKTDGGIEEVDAYFGDVEKAWCNVQGKHEEYVVTLDADGNAEEDGWIMEIQERYLVARKRYVQFKLDVDTRAKFKSLERAREIEYETFMNFYVNLDNSVKNKFPKETIIREKNLIAQQFEVVKHKHSEFRLVCTDVDDKSHANWLNNVFEKLSSINNLADLYIRTVGVKTESRENLPERTHFENVKIDKMPLPKFEGNARFYHRFKSDFYEIVLPNTKGRGSAFALRQCLSKEVDRILGSGDYTVDEIFKRLDDKFGDPSKITDSIICEIIRFKRILDDDTKRIIDFINIIERAAHDLKSVKMESEINNTNVVSIIEQKLPKSLALNWY